MNFPKSPILSRRSSMDWTCFQIAPLTLTWLFGMTFLQIIGCNGIVKEDRTKRDLGVEVEDSPYAKSPSYRDTIGSMTYFDGLNPMAVRGYGLVVGLGKNGSTDCPREVYDRLIQSIYKLHRTTPARVGEKVITPERMINDLDTAVVLVQGMIPPAAVKGMRFDLSVSALPGTQTKSLRAGRLYTAELNMFRSTPNGPLLGAALAKASGPLFINPFTEGEAATHSNPLEGIVLGGGVVTEDRRVRIVLAHPSYATAQRIQDRINSQFAGKKKIADAVSPSFVQLTVPEEFHDETAHFLNLVRCLFIPRDPAFEQTRARELGEELLISDTRHDQIALCLEGLGRNAMPVINDLYGHSKDHVSFHAAIAGLRLGDHIAADVMTTHAMDEKCPYRMQAIRALQEAKGLAGAASGLRRLLEDNDPRVRVAAYEALVDRGDFVVTSQTLGGDNFQFDLAPSSKEKLIYVKRTGERRIALIGQDIRCEPPLLYRAPDGSITIDAKESEDAINLIRMVPSSGSISPPVTASLDVSKLVELLGQDADVDSNEKVIGLGLDYAAVTRALYFLCKDQAIGAEFILEQPTTTDIFGPTKPEGRPESEL